MTAHGAFPRGFVDADKQWRIETGFHLKGAALQWQRWETPGDDWDHDHCSCCGAKFAEWDGPEIQHDGYTTTDEYKHGAGYHWICRQCFADLHDEMEWHLLAE